MRRAALWSGLVLGLGLGLSGTGAAGENPPAGSFAVEFREASQKAPIGMLAPPAPRQRGATTPERTGPRRRDTRRPRRPSEPWAALRIPQMPGVPHEAYVGLDALDLTPLPEFSPPLTRNFPALPDNEGGIPPDTHGAVGPTKVMTTLNTEVRVQNHDGSHVSTTTLDAFWSSVRTAPVFGPRVLFDPDPAYPDPVSGEGRWIWAAVQGARSAASGLLVGVSTDKEPTRGTGLLIDVDDTETIWADYPSVGFNKKWVVVQMNMYLVANDTWHSTHIYVYDKAKLYAGTATGARLFYSSVDGGSQVPAVTHDYAAEELYLLQTWSPFDGQLQLLRLDGPVDSETLSPVGFPTTDPWADQGDGTLDFAPQVAGPPGCMACTPPCKIQTNDSRIQNVVYRAGTLWASQTVFLPQALPTRSSVQWWQIEPGGAVLQRGLVDDPGNARFYAFPSLAVNRHGDVLIGYSSFDGSDYAGARYSYRNAFDEANKLRKENHLQDGTACYYREEGAGNRWGDYSATVVDPTDDTGLWTIQEYADDPVSNVDHWGTWWGVLDLTRTISIADVSVDEGDSGATALTFTLTLSEPTTETVSVEWATADDTATTADGDYLGVANAVVTFDPGDVDKAVTITVNGDITYEADETFFVNLLNPAGATLSNTQAKGTILNDDPMPQISIGDIVVAEGNGDVLDGTSFTFPVTLSNPSSIAVQASWGTAAGSATPGSTLAEDYSSATGSVNFLPGETLLSIVVAVHADDGPEPDEMFSVILSAPSGGTLLKNQGVGTILNDDASNPAVEGLAATSDGPPVVASGRNRLQWKNPSGGNPTGIRIKWETSAAKCATYPGAPGTVVVGQTADLSFDGAGIVQRWDHTGLTLDTFYCYTVWVDHSGVYSAGQSAMGQPFNASGRTKWKYFSGATAVAPPTVGLDGVLAPSNDNLVHAMERGPTGGGWPASWNPVNLGSPAQQRSPIVPLAGVWRAFFTTQDGRVHSVNAKTGALIWSAQLSAAAQGAPAGIFTDWGGVGDYILVGTRAASNNRIYALDPFTGAVIDTFPQAADGVLDLGAVNGMGTVDYAADTVYFTSWSTVGSPETVWCLKLGPPSDALSLEWKKEKEGLTPLGNITGSPVKRGNRIYVGNDAGRVWAIDATAGTPAYYFDTSDPGPIDFVFPDRGSTALYFSSADYVWGLLDDESALTEKWTLPVFLVGSNPSAVLLWPGTKHLYAGVENLLGQPGLLEIDVSLGDPNSLVLFHPLEANPAVMGAPSLDIGHDLIHIGSEAGILYAVQVPF